MSIAVLYCVVECYLALTCVVLSGLISPCLVLSCLFLSRVVLACLVLYHLAYPILALPVHPIPLRSYSPAKDKTMEDHEGQKRMAAKVSTTKIRNKVTTKAAKLITAKEKATEGPPSQSLETSLESVDTNLHPTIKKRTRNLTNKQEMNWTMAMKRHWNTPNPHPSFHFNT